MSLKVNVCGIGKAFTDFFILSSKIQKFTWLALSTAAETAATATTSEVTAGDDAARPEQALKIRNEVDFLGHYMYFHVGIHQVARLSVVICIQRWAFIHVVSSGSFALYAM